MPAQRMKAIARPWSVLGLSDSAYGVGGVFGLHCSPVESAPIVCDIHVAGESRCQNDPSRSSHSACGGTEQFIAGSGSTTGCKKVSYLLPQNLTCSHSVSWWC